MSFLSHFLSTHYIFIYPTIIAGMFIEGTFSLLFFGALSHGPNVSFLIVFIFAIIGELIHDTIFWSIGNKIKKTHEKSKYSLAKLEKLKSFFENIQSYLGIYVFLSKFIWNINRITTISVGYSGMKFNKFIKISFASTILWVSSLMSVGYVFADQAEISKQGAWDIGIVFGFIFIMVIFIQIIFYSIIKKYNIGNNGNENDLKQETAFSKIIYLSKNLKNIVIKKR